MNEKKIEKILFICFIIVFLVSFALMAWGITLQFNKPDTQIHLLEYITKLITGEIVVALITIFYFTFNASKKEQHHSNDELKYLYFTYREFLNKFIKTGSKVEIYCSGIDQFSEFIRVLKLNEAPKNVSIIIYYRERNDSTVENNIASIKESISKCPKLNWKITLISVGWRLTFPSLLIVDSEHAALDFYINRNPEKSKNTMLILGKYAYTNIKENKTIISKLVLGDGFNIEVQRTRI